MIHFETSWKTSDDLAIYAQGWEGRIHTVELDGNNTYTGTTLIHQGNLLAPFLDACEVVVRDGEFRH